MTHADICVTGSASSHKRRGCLVEVSNGTVDSLVLFHYHNGVFKVCFPSELSPHPTPTEKNNG
jgi:hypothetical protein